MIIIFLGLTVFLNKLSENMNQATASQETGMKMAEAVKEMAGEVRNMRLGTGSGLVPANVGLVNVSRGG
jgi:hypothetical protein